MGTGFALTGAVRDERRLDAQIIPDLARGSPFRWALMSL